MELQLVPSLLNVGWLHFTKPRNVQYRIKGCVRTSRLLEISWSYFTGASFTSNHNLQSYSLHTFLGNGLKIEKIQQKCQIWDGWRSIHIHYYIAFLKQQNHQGTNRILRDLSVSKKFTRSTLQFWKRLLKNILFDVQQVIEDVGSSEIATMDIIINIVY